MLLAADLPLPSTVTVTDAQARAALGVVEAYCGWPLQQGSFSVALDSDGSHIIALPSLYVTSVSSLSLRGLDRFGQPFPALVEDVDWEWSTNGVLTCLRGDGWPAGSRRVLVTYVGGYDELPAGVISVVASVAERLALDGAIQQRLENVGGIQTNTTYAQSVTAGGGLSSVECAVLDRWRIAVAR